jgi:serine/threonine protein kinase
MKVDTALASRYQVLKLLSQKAGRLTFLAQDLRMQKLVIIKVLRFDYDFHWDDLKLFEREAAILQNLDRPEIPKYLDYFEVETEDTHGFALVQSYIDAPSLATHIAAGRRFSEAEVIELADKLLDVLVYLHGQHPQIVHRDIKPSNILLTNRSGNSIGDVYLVDFGSVQMTARKEEGTITIVGSYGYIPLEQFGGQATTASDLYSLGMTLIYLLTGTHPAQLSQVDGHVKFTAEIDRNLKRWLDKMTYPHLDKRFDSAHLAQVALKSEDGSYGDFNHLKPTDTQVQLYRDREKLEICWWDADRERTARINAIPTHFGKIFGWILVLLCITFIASFAFAVNGHQFLASILLQLTGFFVVSAIISPFITGFIVILVLIGEIITSGFAPAHYSLTIDRDSICYCKSRSPSHKRTVLSKHPQASIGTLAYNPGYTFDRYLDDGGTVVRRGEVTVPPKLYLCCSGFDYNGFEYSIKDKLSRAEFWWLGQELSDFLDLELQVIYPTPKVPPAPSCGGGC